MTGNDAEVVVVMNDSDYAILFATRTRFNFSILTQRYRSAIDHAPHCRDMHARNANHARISRHAREPPLARHADLRMK